MSWKEIKSRRDWPKAGSRVLVTRSWKRCQNSTAIANVVLYKGKKYFVRDPVSKILADNYPYDNVIAWMELPEPFEKGD